MFKSILFIFLFTSVAQAQQNISGFTVFLFDNIGKKKESVEYLRKELNEANKVFPAVYVNLLHTRIPIHVYWDRQNPSQFVGISSGAYKTGILQLNSLNVIIENQKANRHRATIHELAHAVDFIVLDRFQGEIQATYRQAMERRLYQNVYARANFKEYFAELSCVYLVERLDYSPSNRRDLKAHDPEGFKLMQKVWGKK